MLLLVYFISDDRLSAGSASLPQPCTGKCSAGRHPIIKELIVVTYEFDFDVVEIEPPSACISYTDPLS